MKHYLDNVKPIHKEPVDKEIAEFNFAMDEVEYGLISECGVTRYSSKREAIRALDKVLEDRRLNDKIVTGPALAKIRERINHTKDVKCKRCGGPAIIESDSNSRYGECNFCNNQRRKREYEKDNDEDNKKDIEEFQKYPILKYCADIYNEKKYQKPTFERCEQYEIKNGAWKHAQYRVDSQLRWDKSDLMDLTKSQFDKSVEKDIAEGRLTKLEADNKWKRIMHEKKMAREERDTIKRDWDFVINNTPKRLFENEVLRKIECKCFYDSEKTKRTGEICKACALILKVSEYTFNLFKDAAQGRSTIL
jgi:hypothetical protein